jgi:protein-S-isoprenylcysteine O-methyltransferase Ste14
MTGEDSSGVRIFPPAIFLVALSGGFLLQWIWPARIAPEAFAPVLRWAGGALIAVWLGLAIWAVITFRRAGTTPHPNHPTTALTFGGPYAFTRNPMYLGFVLMSVGVAFVANALWPLLTVLPAILTVRRAVIHKEEAYLARKFGAPYEDYKKRVRRWL